MSELITEEKYAELAAQCQKLRANYEKQMALLLQVEQSLALRFLCPEFCVKGRGIGHGWHDIGDYTWRRGPWEFVVHSKGERRTFSQKQVPEVLWGTEQRVWMKHRNALQKRRTG